MTLMMRIVLDLVAVYAFAFLTGWGIYRLLAPQFLRRHAFAIGLIPCLGLWQLSIVSAYVIYFNLPIANALVGTSAVGVAAIVASLFVPRKASLASPPARNLMSFAKKAGAVALLLCALLAPVLRAGFPTTPYRIGIDQVGYAETAQYLVEGGTLAKARSDLLRRLDTTDLLKAKLQNIRSLNFETYVDSEFLLKAFRWGFPGAVAALTILTGSEHVYHTEFLITLFACGLLMLLAYLVLQDYFLVPSWPALAITAAIALNCNLLNVYYEGEFTQIFMLPCFSLLLILYLHARTASRHAGVRSFAAADQIRALLLFAFLVASLFSTYNETIILVAGFVVITIVLDLFLYRAFRKASALYVAVGFAAGFLAAFPIGRIWFVYTVANLRNLSNAGFWQPHWASLAEILGIFNMYYLPGYTLLARPLFNEVANLVLSLALAAAFAIFLWKAATLDKSFWSAPALIILAAYVKMHYLDHILNYPYMKVYTMLTPLLVCGVFGGLYLMAARLQASRARSLALYAQYCLVLVVAVTGVCYITQYLIQGSYVTQDMFSLYRYRDGHRRFDRFALLEPRHAPTIADFMLTPLISMNLVNENGLEKYVAPFLNDHTAIVFRSDDLTCRDCFVRSLAKHMAYENGSYIVVDTGVPLRNICSKEANRYTLGHLGTHEKGDWRGLPSPQCDYDFGTLYRPYAR